MEHVHGRVIFKSSSQALLVAHTFIKNNMLGYIRTIDMTSYKTKQYLIINCFNMLNKHLCDKNKCKIPSEWMVIDPINYSRAENSCVTHQPGQIDHIRHSQSKLKGLQIVA